MSHQRAGGLPPLSQGWLQPLWRYFGLRDRGEPDAVPVPAGFTQDATGDLLTWAYTQPTGENALLADGFILYLDAGSTPDPVATQFRLAVESRSFLAAWAPAGARSYALAAYRNTHGGEALGPKVQLAAWQGATGGASSRPFASVVTTVALSGASVTIPAFVPAGKWLLGVFVVVVTDATGCTSFACGTATLPTAWGPAIADPAGSTNDPTTFTMRNLSLQPAALDVVLTANGANFTGGTAQVTVWYLDPTLL